MKYYKDENNQVYAFEKDGSQDDFIGDNLIEITEAEADALRAPAPFIPTVVTMRQARLALFDAGLLSLIDESIALMPIVEQREKSKIEWEYATEVKRDSALVYGLAGVLGLTDEMLDNLFIEASKL